MDQAKGCRAKDRNRLQEAAPAPFSREAGRRDRHPAAFDPHPGPGGLPGRELRRHRKRRPAKSLPRLTRAGGRGRCSVSEGPNGTKPPRACVELCGKKSRPAPGRRRAFLAGGARATAPSPFLMPPGPEARAPQVRIDPDVETAAHRRRYFRAAGFGAGGGRALSPPAPPPHQQNLRLGCAKTAILYPLPEGARRGERGFRNLPSPNCMEVLRSRRFCLSPCGRGSNFSILAQAKC